MAVAGVVDDDIQAAEMLVGLGDSAERCVPVRDIQRQRQQRVAVLCPQVVKRARVPRRSGDTIPALQRCVRPLSTEAARCTGDEPRLTSHEAIVTARLAGLP